MGRTVLLVEDDADDEYLLAKAFRSTGSDVALHVVRDGVEAIDYLSGAGAYTDKVQHPLPDLVLLDLKLPRKNGFDVLSHARADPVVRFTPVVILSASRAPGELERAMQLGANAFLYKADTFAQARDMVHSVVDFWLRFHVALHR